MKALKGIYNNGMIDMPEKPKYKEPIEVIVIFPEKNKRVKKIGGLFKNADIDYEQIENDLKGLSRNSEKHIDNEWKHTQ